MHLGLRARIIAVLAVVSALTLGVAAILLLSPLDRRLEANALRSFAVSVHNERGAIAGLPASDVAPGNRRLLRVARVLAAHNGAAVTIFDERGDVLVSTDPDDTEAFRTIAAAAASTKTQRVLTGEGTGKRAEVSFAVRTHDRRLVVAARKSLRETRDATAVVRRAFLGAAAAGLAGALLVGLLLAGRLARRLRRLRDTAERVATIGPEAELRPDRAQDEIGDLSRAFATMQQRLKEQEQARRAFVATASHELRTPLASLSVMMEMILDDLRAEPAAVASATEQAGRAEAQVERLSVLAGRLLDLSRIDARLPLRHELVELSALTRSVVAEFELRLGEAGRTVDLQCAEAPWAVGDPGSVAQIVRVLLDNALRHSPQGGAIELRLGTRDGRAQVVVADDGPGVDAADAERIFERFARGTNASQSGFGLGLAIGRELARQMDGDLTLETTTRGATFVLSLPSAPAP